MALPSVEGSNAVRALAGFVRANENAATSPNYTSDAPDQLDPLATLFTGALAADDHALTTLVLKALKILSRKFSNRLRIGALVMHDLVQLLGASDADDAHSAEAANVALNVCYERKNVLLLTQAGGIPPLVSLLRADNLDVQANAAGALQSICYQKEGRGVVRENGALQALVPLLSSPSIKVQTRATGAMHNLSSDADAIRIIRRLRGVPPLVSLLNAPSAAICASAAGALQNVSRELAAADEALRLGAVVPLTDLLFAGDVQVQVSAAGALLNVLSTKLGSDSQKASLKRLLSVGLTLGALHTSIHQSMGDELRVDDGDDVLS